MDEELSTAAFVRMEDMDSLRQLLPYVQQGQF